MYMIHQEIYTKMIVSGWRPFLIGEGKGMIEEVYPGLADREEALSILSQYKEESLLDIFCTYMDPHNEYLRLAASFGVPAAILFYIFWMLMPSRLRQGTLARQVLAYYVASLLMVSLWDDILSKRWIWCAAGIILSIDSGRLRSNEISGSASSVMADKQGVRAP